MTKPLLTKACAAVVAAAGLFAGAGAANAAIMTSGCVGATSCTLQELFDGGSITIDNVAFSAWAFQLDAGNDLTATAVTVSGIDAVPTGQPGKTTLGLRFVFDPALFLSVSEDSLEIDYDYTATASNGAMLVDATLNLLTHAVVNDAFIEINTVPSTGGLITVFENDMGSMLSDTESLGMATSVIMDGNIQGEVFEDGASTSLSEYSVIFTVMGGTTSTPMPEPASMMLLGVGLAGLGAMRRRKAA